MVNWSNVLSDFTGRRAVVKFASGELSRDNLLKVFSAGKNREANTEVRQLVRSRGAQNARRIAREALKRRGITVD
jgi:hypothetical protein